MPPKWIFRDGEEREDGTVMMTCFGDKRKVQHNQNLLIIIEIVMQIGFHTTAQCSACLPSLPRPLLLLRTSKLESMIYRS